MKTVLMVDDEAKIREVVASYLENEGFKTQEAGTGAEALQHVAKGSIDLVILDLMLPDMMGEQVCRQIRQRSSVPILMLTAKVAADDRIEGLTLGADDYLTKPFNPRELVARVRAILRRSTETGLLADRIHFAEGLVIDTRRHEVFKKERPLNLTPNEYRLLISLARHPDRTFTREQLIEKVLGFDFDGDARTIDQHIKNLRHKLEVDPKNPQFLVTVYGVGYRFAGGAAL